MARFIVPRDREVIKHLLSLAGGDLGLVEKLLRENDVPRAGVVGSIANAGRNRTAPKRS